LFNSAKPTKLLNKNEQKADAESDQFASES